MIGKATEAGELIEIKVHDDGKERLGHKGLHRAGIIETRTMREFDALCLPPVKNLTAGQIRRLRTRNKVTWFFEADRF